MHREHAAGLLIAIDESVVTSSVLQWGRYLANDLSMDATVLHALDVSRQADVAAGVGIP